MTLVDEPLLDEDLEHALGQLLVAGNALLDLLDELQPVLDRPAWQADALCLEYPDVEFFPEPDELDQVAAAKAICARCIVRDDCLAQAVAFGDTDGIWAGMAGDELAHRLDDVEQVRHRVIYRTSAALERRLALEDRDARALELRRDGKTLQAIADELGFNSREVARLAVQRAERDEKAGPTRRIVRAAPATPRTRPPRTRSPGPGPARPREAPLRPIPHGTNAGAKTHQKRGEKPCPACLEARRQYLRQWRKERP